MFNPVEEINIDFMENFLKDRKLVHSVRKGNKDLNKGKAKEMEKDFIGISEYPYYLVRDLMWRIRTKNQARMSPECLILPH